jgi:hypothetical protein
MAISWAFYTTAHGKTGLCPSSVLNTSSSFKRGKRDHQIMTQLPFFYVKNKTQPVCSSKTKTTDVVHNTTQAYARDSHFRTPRCLCITENILHSCLAYIQKCPSFYEDNIQWFLCFLNMKENPSRNPSR